MIRAVLRVAFVLAVCAAFVGSQQLRADPEHARPPHVLPPVSAGLPGPPPEVNAAEVAAWIEGQERGEWVAGVEAAERVEAARVADLARGSATRSDVGSVGTGDCAALAAQWGLPVTVIERESGCRLDAYNPTGCSGRGCVGLAQLDVGHFGAVSPWNPNVPGACYGLDPGSVDGQRECAGRLGPSAWR